MTKLNLNRSEAMNPTLKLSPGMLQEKYKESLLDKPE